MFELMDAYSQSAVIKVLGVGGGGGNAVAHMVTSGIDGVDFMCINTDAQALKHSKVKTALQIGCNITKGLGAGADPEVGRQAAMEDRDRIVEMVEGCDMLFITAGMGGGTGTGAAPVVAQIAKELGILTVAVVTRPFEMEGGKRSLVADHGIAELGKYCDSLITIPNQKLLTVLGASTTLLDAFKAANQVLQGAVQGIAELITRPGLINVDFADVRTVMAETGMAMMGSGSASGEGRAREAAEAAVSSPLLEDINLAGAHGILVNVSAGMDLSIGEFQEVGQIVKQFASEDATVVVGTVIDPELTTQIRVTVVATGLGRPAAAVRPEIRHHREGPLHHREAPMARGGAPLARGGTEPVATREQLNAREQMAQREQVAPRNEPPMRVVRRQPLSNSDYAALDKPTVQRQRAVGDGLRPESEEEDLLDIPAFLRRQAD
jgi:cell division protein FtsZ